MLGETKSPCKSYKGKKSSKKEKDEVSKLVNKASNTGMLYLSEIGPDHIFKTTTKNTLIGIKNNKLTENVCLV